MKKSIISILAVAGLCLSCNKSDSFISESEIPAVNPANEVLSPDDQRLRFQTAANHLMDNINPSDFEPVINSVTELAAVDWDNYEQSQVVEDLIEAIEKMTTVHGDVSTTIYELSALRGHYTANGTKVTKEDASNIEIKVEDRWFLKVDFSSETRRLPLLSESYIEQPPVPMVKSREYSKSEILVDVPVKATVTLSDNGKVMLKIEYNLDFNVNDMGEDFNPDTDWFWGGISLNLVGYEIKIHEVGLKNGTARLHTTMAKNGKYLISEDCSVSGVEFDEGVPQGAGRAEFRIDVLGEIQAKASTADVNAIVELAESMDSENEMELKEAAGKLNAAITNGIYFGSDIRQSHFEVEVLKSQQEHWYATPVFVLDDGTKFEDLSGFFTEKYFESVLHRFEKLIEDFERLIP